MASFSGSVVWKFSLVDGGWCKVAGDIDLFGLIFPMFLSFLANFGEIRSSFPVDPIEKFFFTGNVVLSGEVCVPVCVTFLSLSLPSYNRNDYNKFNIQVLQTLRGDSLSDEKKFI